MNCPLQIIMTSPSGSEPLLSSHNLDVFNSVISLLRLAKSQPSGFEVCNSSAAERETQLLFILCETFYECEKTG